MLLLRKVCAVKGAAAVLLTVLKNFNIGLCSDITD